jgi:hypothetical protein
MTYVAIGTVCMRLLLGASVDVRGADRTSRGMNGLGGGKGCGSDGWPFNNRRAVSATRD